jgi:O-6-methylguanine DNA methyltransferase
MNLWSSALGDFEIETTDSGISKVAFSSNDAEQLQNGNMPATVDAELANSLNEHLYGRPASLHLDLSMVTSPIAQLTLAKLLEIPYGEIRSYAWVAKEIGHASAVRPVANAVATNPLPVLIPCHRVVRSDGHIGNYSFGGPSMKYKILQFEGLDIARAEDLATRGIRLLADKETNLYHVPSCRHAPKATSTTAQELHHVDEALSAHLDPCRRCRPL